MKSKSLTIVLILAAFVMNSSACDSHSRTKNGALESVKAETKIFNNKDFGAVGDSITLDTEAIQKAIDACNKAGGGTEEEAKNVVNEDIPRYRGQYFFGVLPAWGAYIRHAKNIQFKNVEMTTREIDQREMIVLDDVDNFKNLE